MRQTSALVRMQRPVQPVGQPRAQHLDLLRIPPLHGADHEEVIGDLLAHLVHVAPHEAHVLLSQRGPVAGHVVLILNERHLSRSCRDLDSIWRVLTAKDKKDPMILPSSYLPSLERTLSRTDTSLLVRPTLMLLRVFSMRSSILVWYLCYGKHKIRIFSQRLRIKLDPSKENFCFCGKLCRKTATISR